MNYAWGWNDMIDNEWLVACSYVLSQITDKSYGRQKIEPSRHLAIWRTQHKVVQKCYIHEIHMLFGLQATL